MIELNSIYDKILNGIDPNYDLEPWDEKKSLGRKDIRNKLKARGKVLTSRMERKNGKRIVLEKIGITSDPEMYWKKLVILLEVL
jgi:hypothetical protein